tara:strand:+ start:962 stop:1492 length:531 start_codon:yes stop_codon:yes gene_type:complete
VRHTLHSPQLDIKSDGFTLVELLVVISIVAISLSIALPNYSDFVHQKSVETAANDFKSAVGFARSEAIKRGKNIQIRPVGKTQEPWGSLTDGWHVFYTTRSNQVMVLLTHDLESGSIGVSGSGKRGFYLDQRTGRLGTGANQVICFSAVDNSANLEKYTVTLNQVGSAVTSTSSGC